jgi:phage shock protein E
MNPFRLLSVLALSLLVAVARGADAPTAAAAPAAPAAKAETPVARIDPAQAAKLVAEGKAVLVDCREAAEWAETGVAGPATLLAKSDFDATQAAWKPFLEANKDKQIIVYCRSGNRSGIVTAALQEKGFNVANAGAFSAWQAAGLPTRTVEKKDAPAAAPAK